MTASSLAAVRGCLGSKSRNSYLVPDPSGTILTASKRDDSAETGHTAGSDLSVWAVWDRLRSTYTERVPDRGLENEMTLIRLLHHAETQGVMKVVSSSPGMKCYS